MTYKELRAVVTSHAAWNGYRAANDIASASDLTKSQLEEIAVKFGMDLEAVPAETEETETAAPAPVAKPAPAPVPAADPLASLRPILSPDILKDADKALASIVADLDTVRRERDAARIDAQNAAVNAAPVTPGAGRVSRKIDEKTVGDLIGSRAQIAQVATLPICDCPDAPAVDPDYIPDATLLSEIALAMATGANIALFGDRGTGKSSLVKYLAALTRRPHFEIAFHGETSGQELFGSQGIEGDGMAWVPGDLLVAMQTPWAIVDLSEISVSRPELVMQLNAVLEQGSRSIFVGGRRFPVHPTVSFFATSNDNGSGENAHQFAGVRPMNNATRSRFIWVELNLPNKAALSDMLAAATGLPKAAAEMLADFETKMRDHVKQAKAETTPGMRALKGWGRLVKAGLGADRAFAMAVEHVASSEDGALWRQDLKNFDLAKFEALARGEEIPGDDDAPAAPDTRFGFDPVS